MSSFVPFFAATARAVVLVLLLPLPVSPVTALEIRQNPKVVVELFTSQGCASCPPADEFLAGLGQREDLVTLAYHVDYWDYVGWEDTFALPENGELQRAYAQAWGKGRIFTPQMVLNGSHGVVGTQADKISASLETLTLPVLLRVTAHGDSAVQLDASGHEGYGDAIVWLVTFRSAAEVTVDRGENSGRELTYTHIVTSRRAVGMWSSEEGFAMRMPLSETMGSQSDGAAFVIQEKQGPLPGPVIGAALVLR